jgi:hypothetical protein
MPKKRSHSKQSLIPQKLREEEARLKEKGLKIKGTSFNRDGPNKLSQAITTLISPYKDMGSTYQSFSALIAIACMAWNASLVDEPERGEMVNQVVNFFKDKTDTKGMLEFSQFSYELIKRKLLLFPNDRRFVYKFDVTETKDDFHVFVLSLDK